MEDVFVKDKLFEMTNFNENPLIKGEYEDCRFINCDFSGTSLSGSKFFDCIFIECNLSLTNLSGTALSNIQFKECKMLGIHFDLCTDFGLTFRFENCSLNHSSFYGKKIRKTIFINCQLVENDFTDADLTSSIFENCNLLRSSFQNTILERADLRTSFHYSIDPEANRIKKAKFSLSSVAGLLYKYDIEIDRTS
jgi:fluoroquinolone resistance protein